MAGGKFVSPNVRPFLLFSQAGEEPDGRAHGRGRGPEPRLQLRHARVLQPQLRQLAAPAAGLRLRHHRLGPVNRANDPPSAGVKSWLCFGYSLFVCGFLCSLPGTPFPSRVPFPKATCARESNKRSVPLFQASMGSGPKLPGQLVSIGTTGFVWPRNVGE